MTSTTLWLIAGAFVVLMIFQRRNLKRLLIAVSAQFGKLATYVWGIDPIAVYQAEVDRSAEELQSAGEALEQYRGMVSRLERQVANGEKDELRVKNKIDTYLASNDDAKAEEQMVLLAKIQKDLAENRSQLAEYHKVYDNNLKKVKFANEKIRSAKEKAEKMSADLRMSKADAETAKLAKQLNCRTSTLDGLSEIEEEIQRQIDVNRAKGQVTRDLSQDGLDEIEEEEKLQRAEAKEMLKKYKSAMNK